MRIMKFLVALFVAMSIFACGLLNKDKEDTSDELKKKELELKERELALKEKNNKEEKEQEIKDKEETLSQREQELSAKEEYLKSEDEKQKYNRTRDRTNYSGYPGAYPEASTRYLTNADLRNKSKWQLKIMRNEIYARHGYIFQTTEMRNYFNNQGWYNPVYYDVSHMLTSIEKSNIAYIKKFE